ncbi:uncharacterized protein LY89DRAFT_623658 [Mollisia scopiformis]|uniref:Uncharacterized protein n=1 Tax=Mollisia scopiformis TaxID=149040 RepID=A0A194WX30_MOLSC|nr:uncharacterized protein LY89DRAFT_623658 [Mollisia scopiformis]KUJ12490.1 hypothetical protein LY89DRAFT_623658 [Mollisia scopiformis]
MAEQMGTPGSNADTSVNGSKTSAPKDKACPFCNQQFTSSSLGRHLDLYIKEKNPKPADGIHDVVEIRKLRGGITRRQPRNSTSRREDSTPAATPGAQERRSPRPESDRQGNRSPSLRREDNGPVDTVNFRGKPSFFINKGTWESTGVMNHIPAPRNNSDARSWDGEDREAARRMEPRSRSVSKQMLAKTTFEQKQKMMDALDNAKAAELALRELLGSMRAAKQRIEGPSIFDYDPLTLDFPALCLHCLPPPPTLHTSSPIPTSTSWSILPPSDGQYQALRSHFVSEFHRYRISCAIATTTRSDDLSYPPQPALFDTSDLAEITARAEAQANELETKISEHLHAVFGHWNSLPVQRRTEIWTLELARSVGKKSEELSKLKKDKEYAQQEATHLKQQVEELSRLQHPREYKISPPTTVPCDRELITTLADMRMSIQGVGFSLIDRNVDLDTAIERAVGRWKGVVREARGGGGLSGQRSLSGESSAAPPNSSGSNPTPTISMKYASTNGNGNGVTSGGDGMGSDADADADADMEEDDDAVEMSYAPQQEQGRAPEAPMAGSTNFRLANGNVNTGGNGQQGRAMEGIENQVVQQGYVRIGA